MKLPRRKFLHLAAGAAALPAIPHIASAQTYPTRPLTLVVGFAAGGPSDVAGRIIAQRMSEILGQQVVVENLAGAGGTVGSLRVAMATPDGPIVNGVNWMAPSHRMEHDHRSGL
jgi:tripartite-type tricarboxylate transporter receptor subunit TctC